MPFKIKLKKSRQYNVASKSLFVVSVELLDGVVVENTVGSESLGRECLENVCERLAIARPELFGLRFNWRGRGARWIDLERPLKRQLDKRGASTHQLHLRVAYYVAAPATLDDDATRYHYFLQLKNDAAEGKLPCDRRQAVLLAAYSRQAEYGNRDAERHTVDYLKHLIAFPKQMRDGAGRLVDPTKLDDAQLEALIGAVIRQHQMLYNLPQAQAEEGYIATCQQLPGYGQETFTAQDQPRQTDVDISISLLGITLHPKNSNTSRFYKWTDIQNVINHKRNFSIECQNPADSASFVFASAEDGKYVWRMCVLQHTFYSKYQQSLGEAGDANHSSERLAQPKFQNDGLSDSRDDLDCALSTKESSVNLSAGLGGSQLLRPHAYGGSQQELQSELAQPLSSSQRALSTSCLDLTVSNPHLQSQNDIDKLRALLPTYRAAPDYDTAIQQKYNQQLQQPQPTSMSLMKPYAYGSQPDMDRPIHYPDVTRHTAVISTPMRLANDIPYAINPLNREYLAFPLNSGLVQTRTPQVHYLNVYKPPPPYPSNGLVSNSTPDLAIASQSISPAGYYRSYINSHVSGSSPDLVSSRTFLSRQYLNRMHGANVHLMGGYPGVQPVMPPAHGTYENLASVMDKSHYLLENQQQYRTHMQNMFGEQSNLNYCVPAQVPYRNHMVLQQHQKLKTVSDSQEPIYENVPLPWQSEQPQPTVRDRAFSFASAPDVSRVAERKVSQPISIMLNSNQNAQTSVSHATVLPPPAFNSNVNPAINHYVNAQAIQSSSTNPAETPLEPIPTEKTSSKTDLSKLTSSLSISKEFERKSSVSLKGSVTGINVNNNQMIQTSDNNNITTITISSDNQPYIFEKVPSTYMKKSKTADILNSTPMSDALDFTLPTSSFFDSTQGTYDLESSTNSSNISGASQSTDKKKRRWMMFGGRNQKSETKSATLGRDKGKKNQSNQSANEKHRWSAALPKLQPLPPSISKEAMCQLLERKMVDTQLSLAFEQMPKGRDNNTDMTMALNPENAILNAGNIEFLPYEDNRVRLTPTKMNRHGYINASHITATVGSNQRFYIACSLGNPGAVSALISNVFWQAVWEVGARVLAFVSANPNPDHLPDLLPGQSREYGQYQVFVESSQSTEFVVMTRLRLCGKTNGKINAGDAGTLSRMRTIWHLQYIEWPDSVSIPKSTQHFLGFLEELSAVRQHCATEITPLHNANPPIFVSCLQGAGRTGVTIAADLLLYTLEHNQELDIQRVVGLLHQQRANLLQNVHQYRFIHALLIHYLKQTRLI